MKYAPILVSVYHRPDCFRRCISALKKNEQAQFSELFIVSDEAAMPQHINLVKEVRAYASMISGFKEVHLIYREKNLGSHESIKQAFLKIFESFDRLIFLEDDIIVADDFLAYINRGLDYFFADNRIFSIAAYKRYFQMPQNMKDRDVFFLENFSPWGFGIWRDRFLSVDISDFNRFEALKKRPDLFATLCQQEPNFIEILKSDSIGAIKALDVRIEYHIHLKQMFSVFPCVSRSTNRGFNKNGEHCQNLTGLYDVPLAHGNKQMSFDVPVKIDINLAERFYKYDQISLIQRIYMTIQSHGFLPAMNYYFKRSIIHGYHKLHGLYRTWC